MSKKNYKKVVEVVDADVEKTAPEIVVEAAPELVDFETWYAARKAAIPDHHRMEILKADFVARKLSALGTMAQFDDALKKYGVKLA